MGSGLVRGFGVNDVDYEVTNKITGFQCRFHSRWKQMIDRCKSENHKWKATYSNVTICDEFRSLKYFRSWAESKGFSNETSSIIHLDKDILSNGNLEYSVDKCCFVQSSVNTLFINTSKTNLSPLGVSRLGEGYSAHISRFNDGKYKQEYLGYSKDPMVCHRLWQLQKAIEIDKASIRYKNEIESFGIFFDERVFDALHKRSKRLIEDFELGLQTFKL